MIVSFGEPHNVTIMDADPARSAVIKIADHQIYAVPSWAGNGMIAAVVGADAGDQIALIDVGDPTRARLKEVLWRKANSRDLKPGCPIDSDASRRYVFVGAQGQSMSLYTLAQGQAGPAQPLAKAGQHPMIVDLVFSPDGRYVVYAVHGPG